MDKNNEYRELFGKNIVVSFDYRGKHYVFVIYKNECVKITDDTWEWNNRIIAIVEHINGELSETGFRIGGPIDKEGNFLAPKLISEEPGIPSLYANPVTFTYDGEEEFLEAVPIDRIGAPEITNLALEGRDFTPKTKEDFLLLLKQRVPSIDALYQYAFHRDVKPALALYQELLTCMKAEPIKPAEDSFVWAFEEAQLAIKEINDEYIDRSGGYYLATFIHQNHSDKRQNEVKVITGGTPWVVLEMLLHIFDKKHLQFHNSPRKLLLKEIITSKQDDTGGLLLNPKQKDKNRNRSIHDLGSNQKDAYWLYCWRVGNEANKTEDWKPESVKLCFTEVTLYDGKEPFCMHWYNTMPEYGYGKDPYMNFLIPSGRPVF